MRIPCDIGTARSLVSATSCLRDDPAGLSRAGAGGLAPDGTQGCLKLQWTYTPEYLGIEATDELLVTFNPDLAERHPPTAPQLDEANQKQSGHEGVRLLTWGDPLLEAWPQEVQATCIEQYGLRRHISGEFSVGSEQNMRLTFTQLLSLLCG